MLVCPSCGRENPADARFCAGCAAPLEPEATGAHEVRKTVTVVFCDMTGSTSLGERLDPESLRRVMSRYFEAMRAVLERHGGTVEKFIGDAVMAVFGIPTLHEDDALRAVRAAAEMREALERLNEELEREWGVRIEVRTGVNTGAVVAGDPAAGQSLVVGDAVNVAARLEQTAGPGEILVGAATHELVGEAAEFEPLEPLSLKGKSEPVAAWRLVSLGPEVPPYARPADAPFVGRLQELAMLREALAQAVAERSCRLCTIVGPAGIGKSRLVRELVAEAPSARVVVGRCLPYGEGITFWPLAEILKQVLDSDVRTGVRTLIAGEEHAELVAERIAGAVGAGEAGGQPEETSWAFRRLFEALALERPLVAVIEDIHWAEATLLDLLEYLVSFSSSAPILLVCPARPELFEARPDWGAPRPNTTLLVLQPLADADANRLVDRLTPASDVSDDARRRIVESADGNPLFVE